MQSHDASSLMEHLLIKLYVRTFALSAEVDTLRAQVQDLQRILHEHIANPGHANGANYIPNSSSEMRSSSSLSSLLQMPTDSRAMSSETAQVAERTYPDRQLEHSVSVLEGLAERSEVHTQSTNSMLSATGLTSSDGLALTEHSRIPRLLDESTRNSFLLDSAFEILPGRRITRRLVDCYINGPIHRGWHVCTGRLSVLIQFLTVSLIGNACSFIFTRIRSVLQARASCAAGRNRYCLDCSAFNGMT